MLAMETPEKAAAQPKEVIMEQGKTYALCEHRLSKNQPFCDGTHKKL